LEDGASKQRRKAQEKSTWKGKDSLVKSIQRSCSGEGCVSSNAGFVALPVIRGKGRRKYS